MPRNKLADLNDHLFAVIERLNDDELMKDDDTSSKEIQRAKAISGIASNVVNNAKVLLEAQQHRDEYYGTNTKEDNMPEVFQISNRQ